MLNHIIGMHVSVLNDVNRRNIMASFQSSFLHENMLARTVRDLWHKALATTSLRCRKERYRWSIWTKAWKEYKLAPANVPAMPWPRAWNPCSSMRTILQRPTSWSIIHKMVAAMTSSLVQTTSPMTPASHPNRATHRPCVSPHGIALPCCSRAAPLASITCRMSCRRSSICLFQWTTFSQVRICLFLFNGEDVWREVFGGFFWSDVLIRHPDLRIMRRTCEYWWLRAKGSY